MSEISKIICTDTLSGSISVKIEESIRLRLNLTLTEPLAETDVIKVKLLSVSCPDFPSVNCGTAEMQGSSFRLTRTLNIPHGAECIDTAEIIRKNVFTEESVVLLELSLAEPTPEPEELIQDKPIQEEPVPVIAVDVEPAEEPPSMEEVRRKLSYLQDNEAYRAYLSLSADLKSPVENAAEALENLHKVLSRSHGADAYKKCMEDIRCQVRRYEPVDGGMPPEFEWYRIDDPSPVTAAGALEHILYTPGAVRSFGIYGHYLLGIGRSENTVCVAVPVGAHDPNPISCVDDCTVYVRPEGVEHEYCTVCIAFEPDGQYFMPVC